MRLYSKVMAALLAVSLAAQLVVPAYAHRVDSDTSTGGQVVINNQDGTQQVLTQEDLDNGVNLPEGIVIDNGESTAPEATPSPEATPLPEGTPSPEATPSPEVTPVPETSQAPVPESAAPTQDSGDTTSDRMDMNLPVVSPSTENSFDGVATQQEAPLAVYWNPGSGYALDESELSVAIQSQQSKKGILQQGLDWLSNLVSGVFGAGSGSTRVPGGKDTNSGRSPMEPVKTFDAAMQCAQTLADEQGVDVRDVTIYSMNPQELVNGESLDVSGAHLTVQAWKGRNYDSDVLFYVKDGALTMEEVTLAPRDEENAEDSAEALVQVFDGSVLMGAAVTVNGGFVMDFRQSEAEKAWISSSALTEEKVGSPIIELSQEFRPDSHGYFITVLDQAQDQRLEVVRTSGMTQALLESYAGSFMLTGESSQEWTLEVDEQQNSTQPQARSMTAMTHSAVPVSLSLYAVRAASDVIYWNPGGEMNINGTIYPAGSDTDRSGLAATAPVKTFAKALEMAKTNSTRNIVCMQTITVDESTVSTVIGEQYINYDSGSQTFQLHGELISGQPIVLTNWDQGLPIVNIRGSYTLSLENVQLKGYGSETSQRAMNLVTVGKGTTVTMGAKSSVTGGSYIQLEFSEGVPNPIQVTSTDASATIFASGVTFAPHYDGTVLVQASEALVTSSFGGDKDAAGQDLFTKFALSTLNTTPQPSNQGKPVVWSLVQNNTADQENSLILAAAKTYETIYIDPVRGNDTYDGLTCQFPVQTVERALQVLQEGMDKVLPLREQAHNDGKTDEEIERLYPLPGHVAACSTIEIIDIRNWDWSNYHWEDYTGTVTPYLTAHEEGSLGANGTVLHQAPECLIRVGENGNLTMKNVRVLREVTAGQSWSYLNLVNVINGGRLTLDGTTELSTQALNQAEGISAYTGLGIVAGLDQATDFMSGNMVFSGSSAATITLSSTWTGSIHGLSRGVLLVGEDASMTMNGGSIRDNRNTYVGAAVSAFQGAKFTMNDGTISGNKAAAGAGVLLASKYKDTNLDPVNTSKFTMIKGRIENNTIDLDATGIYGFSGMGGAGIMSYYGMVELGVQGQENNLCYIGGNSLGRTNSHQNDWTSNGVGVSIYGQNPWDDNALVMHSGTITGNTVNDTITTSKTALNVNGIGMSLYKVKSATIEGASITDNTIQHYVRGSSSSAKLQGGGLYVSTTEKAAKFTFQHLTVTGNKMNSSEFVGGTSTGCSSHGGGIYLAEMPNDVTVVLEDSDVSGNEVGLGQGTSYWSVNTYGGGIYSNVYLRINRVTISSNKAGDENSYGGYGGGIYGSVLWANEMTLDANTAKYGGGGWYNTMKRPGDFGVWDPISTVIQDSVITNNHVTTKGPNSGEGDGGGIAFSGFGYMYSCTLTETATGKTKITGNSAAGAGGGVYLYMSGTTIFDFDSKWENTAANGGGNLRSYTYDASSGGVTYILKGTFVGSDSVQAVGTTNRKDLYLDPTQVTFQVAQEGDTAIVLTDPGSVVGLLAPGNPDHPLPIQIDANRFGAGTVVVRPANLDKVTLSTLNSNGTLPGGYEVGSRDQTYAPLTDVSEDSFGGSYSTYITVTGLPLRTQLTTVSEGALTSLGIVAEGVYLDGVNGNDTNDGLSSQTAVQTWGKAVELLEKYSTTPPTEDQKTTGFQPIIWVCGTVNLSSAAGKEGNISLRQSIVSETYQQYETAAGRTPERAVARRFGAFQDGPMFKVTDGDVSISYVRIDGNSAALAQPGGTCYNIEVADGAILNVAGGARIYNSYKSCVYLGNNATLNVTQDTKVADPNTDEGYGIQIDTNPAKPYSGTWYAVSIGQGSVVNLGGYAYLGGTTLTFTSQYALGFRGAGTINMNGQSLVSSSRAICYEAKGAVNMYGSSRLEGGYDVVSFLSGGTDWSTLTMNDDSSIGAGLGRTSGALTVPADVNFSVLMLDRSRIECAVLSDGDPLNSRTENAGLKLVMGREGGTDTPRIEVPSNSSSDYPGSIQAGGGHMYLEMNANSTVKGSIYFWGMYPGSQSLMGGMSSFGLLMRDNAKVEAADGNSAAVVLATGERVYNNSLQTFGLWDGMQPFSIVLEDQAQMVGGIQGDFFYDDTTQPVKDYGAMGDDQHITLRGSAQMQGTIGDKDYETSISSVVLEGNASIQASEGMTAQEQVVKVRQVTMKGTSTISASSSTDADTTVYGQGVSVYALEGMNLEGTAMVEGPIQLGDTASITLTAPVDAGAVEGRYKLHLAAVHMGRVVVKPDGTTVTDASIYLPYFVKYAAQAEAAEVDLAKNGVNIILNRIWNVYLSTNGNDGNDGSSPANAVRTFQRAKQLLTTVEGYGPTNADGTGSNIIIPDSVTIQNHDKDWSFDQGGTLTNVNGETWKPLVTRSTTTVYDEPTIIISSSAYSSDSNPVVFRNITLDAGGSHVQFALGTTDGWLKHQNTLLYFDGGSSGSTKRTVELGEGTVIQNLDYDMANNGTGLTQLTAGEYAGGYAIHVDCGHLVMDGCVIENLYVKNFSYDGGGSGTSADNSATIMSITGTESSLEFKSGAIRNNSIDVKSFRSDSDYGGVGILAVTGGANFIMSGGEISGNVVSGNADKLNRTMSSAVLQAGILVLNPVSYEASAEISGGTIRNNENQLQATDETSEARYTEGIICVGARSQASYSTQSTMVFTISGGSITENQARRGSAIAVAYGTVILAGGTIQNNRSVAEVGSADWKAEYSPIFIGGAVPNYPTYGLQQLVLQGSGCVLDDPIYLPSGRQIVVSGQLRDTDRVYEVYQGDSNLTQGNVVVIPDNNNITDVTPYLQNFHVHAEGLVLDRGRVNQQVSTQDGSRNELSCLVQMKAVFVDGDHGTDPTSISLNTPQNDLGRTPDNPVKTLDAAKAVGQALCYQWEDHTQHQAHKDHYVVYAVGPVYNDVFTGTVTDNIGAGYSKNDSSDNYTFYLEGASYLARYTGWELCTGIAQHEAGDYYYGNLIQVRANTHVVMKNITVRGRREIDSVTSNGETMIVVNTGATLTIQDGTNLERNNVSGTRPSQTDPGLPSPIDTRGGAIRAEAGSQLIVTGGVIDSTCTALTGGSIYLQGAQSGQTAAQLTMRNKVNVGGEIYLGGQQGNDAPILVDSSFSPVGDILIGLQSDYDQKPVVRWTDGTTVTEEMLAQFAYSSSVSALYETEAVSSTEGGALDTIVLNLRMIVYLDPIYGSDTNSGAKPEEAVQTIEQIYTMFEGAQEDIPGILVFVMNPITVGSEEQLVISNGQLQQNGVTKHISVYSKSQKSDTFDTNVSIVQSTEEKVIQCELFFRRYVKTSDEVIPEGYNVESNLQELFVVEGQLQLNGMYLDGQSIGIQTSGHLGLSSDGVVAKAPLVRVEDTGSAQFLSGALENHQEGVSKYQASSTMLTNNTNNHSKDAVLPGTDNITEGSSAGIEILSSGTETGWNSEQRGKVVLQSTKLDNLQLVADDSGKAVIGGSDIYQNGELSVSNNTRFGGSVFLEGNGRSGDDAEAKLSRQTSRWISVSTYGSPVESTFKLTVRDPYQDRRMVKYPYSDSDVISKEEISFYMLTEEASRYYILVNEQLKDGAEENFMGGGENTLWLRIPPAVYIDPVNGDNSRDGRYPETAVQTLPKAFELMTGLSSKVLYVLNPIPITGSSYLYPTGYTYDGNVVALPNQNLQLDIRRYVKPDAPTTTAYYQTESYTSGALFDIQSGGSLTLESSVILDGASQPQNGPEIPADQAYSQGVVVTAPLVTVDQGGTLELRSADEGEAVTRPTLTNNSNTGTVSEGVAHDAGGAIYNEGNVIFNGGVLVNNLGSAGQGKADGIYQAGDLTIRSYPQGLKDQTVYLASSGTATGDHMLFVDMPIQDMEAAAGEISLDMDRAVAGRQVVMYTNATNVDAESARYSLGNSVPGSLFLVESESESNVLELQDWKQLKVSVPEEVFLVVYEAGANGAQIGRADVDGSSYGTPEYTVTNNGTRDVRVSVNGFSVVDENSKGSITLVDSAEGLSGTDALLYLALTKSTESAAEGNSFATLTENSLKMSTGANIELGTLAQSAHGSFGFTGSANEAFITQWMDSSFPATAQEGQTLSEVRKDHMRTKDSTTGETSLNNAAAQFKLTYRIELA